MTPEDQTGEPPGASPQPAGDALSRLARAAEPRTRAEPAEGVTVLPTAPAAPPPAGAATDGPSPVDTGTLAAQVLRVRGVVRLADGDGGVTADDATVTVRLVARYGEKLPALADRVHAVARRAGGGRATAVEIKDLELAPPKAAPPKAAPRPAPKPAPKPAPEPAQKPTKVAAAATAKATAAITPKAKSRPKAPVPAPAATAAAAPPSPTPAAAAATPPRPRTRRPPAAAPPASPPTPAAGPPAAPRPPRSRSTRPRTESGDTP